MADQPRYPLIDTSPSTTPLGALRVREAGQITRLAACGLDRGGEGMTAALIEIKQIDLMLAGSKFYGISSGDVAVGAVIHDHLIIIDIEGAAVIRAQDKFKLACVFNLHDTGKLNIPAAAKVFISHGIDLIRGPLSHLPAFSNQSHCIQLTSMCKIGHFCI